MSFSQGRSRAYIYTRRYFIQGPATGSDIEPALIKVNPTSAGTDLDLRQVSLWYLPSIETSYKNPYTHVYTFVL